MRLLLVLLVLSSMGAHAQSTWVFGNDGGGTWQYRIKITVPASAVDANLTNFPIYVDAADLPADFHANVKSDACDVRWATSDGVTEAAGYPLTYDAGTDTGEFYFLAPLLSSSVDNTFYIYYGNSSATCYATTDTYGQQAVWVDYEYVAHDGGTTNVASSVVATSLGTPTPSYGAAVGIAGNATSYNAGGNTLQGFSVPDPAIHVTGWYISSFINYTSVSGSGFMYLWQHGDSDVTQNNYYRPYESKSSDSSYPRLRGLIRHSIDDFGTVAGQWETNRTPTVGSWEHHAQYGFIGGARGSFLNGASLGGPLTLPSPFDPVTDLIVAAGGIAAGAALTSRETIGIYDEFRLRLTPPTNVDAWAALEYDNYTTTVYSFGAQEADDGSPTAAFSATPLSGVPPLIVDFTDESTNTPTSWSWDVDNDGTPDYTTQNPQHTYNTIGTYTVSLTVTNANGSDTLTKTDYIKVTVNEPTECDNIADTLANDGDPATSLTGCWLPAKTFNDGGTLADSYLDLPDGSHDLTVVGTPPTLGASGWVLSGAGALDTGWPIVAGTDSIIVISEHNGASSSSKLLGRRVGTTVELFWLLPAHPTIGLIYAISDNTNTYANQTGPAVTAEAAFGFRGFQPWLNGGDYLSPIAATAPPASILPVYLGGLNEANVLIDSMPAGSTIGAAVAIAGTPSAATMASIEQELWNSMSPGTPPVADFSGTPTTGTVPFTVNFTDLSTADPGVPITAWSWDVDGGGEDYATQNPSHEYTVPGTYTVSLTATNSDGSSTETKVSYITANAAAAEMRLEITNTTRSYRPSFAPVNPDGFFDDFQPLD